MEQVSRRHHGSPPTVIKIGVSEQQQEGGQEKGDDTDGYAQAG